MHTSLCGMVDCWYGIAKKNGATDDDAVSVTLDKLGEKMLQLGK